MHTFVYIDHKSMEVDSSTSYLIWREGIIK